MKLNINKLLWDKTSLDQITKDYRELIQAEMKENTKKTDLSLVDEYVDTLYELDQFEVKDVDTEEKTHLIIRKSLVRRALRNWRISLRNRKIIAALLVVCFLTVANYGAARAMNLNIIGGLIQYGINCIQFNFKGQQESSDYFYGETVKNIRNDFLETVGFEPVLPRYMPSYLSKHRFEMESVTDLIGAYSVMFEGGGKSLTINILHYIDETRAGAYKSPYAEVIEQLQMLNTDIFILKQGGIYSAVFRLGPVIYNISSNVGHDEFIKIIMSCQEN